MSLRCLFVIIYNNFMWCLLAVTDGRRIHPPFQTHNKIQNKIIKRWFLKIRGQTAILWGNKKICWCLLGKNLLDHRLPKRWRCPTTPFILFYFFLWSPRHISQGPHFVLNWCLTIFYVRLMGGGSVDGSRSSVTNYNKMRSEEHVAEWVSEVEVDCVWTPRHRTRRISTWWKRPWRPVNHMLIRLSLQRIYRDDERSLLINDHDLAGALCDQLNCSITHMWWYCMVHPSSSQ